MECVCKWCVLRDCEWNVFVSGVFYETEWNVFVTGVFYETVSGMCL